MNKFKVGDFVNYADVNNRVQRGQVVKAGDVTLIIITSTNRLIVRHTNEVTLIK